jgi:DinB family protein
MNRELIEKYAAGAEVPAQAIAGLERADLLAFPVPGTWSIQQIILHLMDSDLIASDRMKRVAAEDNPLLVGYNETAFGNRLGYEHLSARDAAEIFRLNRLMTAEILRRLPPAAFARTGQHSERGEVTLEQLLETYTEHVDHHLKFIRDKRKLLGKPMG